MRTALKTALSFAGLLVALASFGQNASQRTHAITTAPLLKILPLFTAKDVPAMGRQETTAPSLPPTAPPPPDLPGHGLEQHPMLYFGEGYNKLLLVNGGKIVWTYQTGPGWEYDDAWVLSNGNVLFTRMQYIAEVTPDKKVLWRYSAPAGTEIHTCQPIGFDKILFIVNGLPPHLMVVNIKTGKTEVNHVLPAISATDQKTVHAQFRRVRYTAKETYLVSFLEMNRVVEYDRNFHEIWSYSVPTPWAAIRLHNGHTLITDEQDVSTREVDSTGKIVWEISKADIPSQYWYGDSQSATRLANGNTILCSRGGAHHGPQLVEVTPDKKVVWVLQDWQHLGPATAVQVLDEPGYPERPGGIEY